MYYDFREPLNKLAGHRILAVNRGEREEFLKVSVDFERAKALAIVCSNHVKEGSPGHRGGPRQRREDAYDRLIFPAIEREIRSELTEQASEAGHQGVFLKPAPAADAAAGQGARWPWGLIPAYRTGCKIGRGG